MNKEARALLFDRLVDKDPRGEREVRPLRTLSRRDLKDSVRRELARLLNSRCSLPVHLLETRPRTVLEYGIPDFSTFQPASHDDRNRLANAMRKAIEAYEPRLSQVRVRFEPNGTDPRRLEGSIEAVLEIDGVAEPIAFPTLYQAESGSISLGRGAGR